MSHHPRKDKAALIWYVSVFTTLFYCRTSPSISSCLWLSLSGSLGRNPNKAYPKIIYKDYTKEHTKPLFKKHEILSIHNLYPYYCLLELYKILKFRTPYSLFELLKLLDGRSGNLNLAVPMTSLQCQRQSFFYQSTVLWNKCYKKLLTLSKAVLHSDHTTALNLTSSEFVFFDFSTKVGSFKTRLRIMLHNLQSSGDETSWSELNYHIRAV